MGRVVNDQDAIIGGVAVCWIPESMSASDLEILAHRLMLLPIKMGLHHDVDFIVSGPVAV